MGILDAPGLTRSAGDARYGPIPGDMNFVNGATHPLTRRVPHIVGASGTTTTATALDITQRTVLVLPLTTTRWRLKIANRNILLNTALTTPVTVTGVHVGTPEMSTSALGRRWTGNGISALSQALGSLTVPTDGTAVTSGWVTDPAMQFAPSKSVLFSMGLTSPNSGTGISSDTALQSAVAPTAGASHSGDASISVLSGFAAPGGFGSIWYLDVVLEYEFVGTNFIGLYLGDSITAGYSSGDIFGTQAGTLTHESFPGSAGLRSATGVINLGVPSATYATFNSLSNYAFSRADITTCRPDFAVVALGTNSLTQFYSTAIGGYATVLDLLIQFGIPRSRILVSTILPRVDAATDGLFGTLAADSAAGATSVSSTVSVANSVTYGVGVGRSLEIKVTNGAPSGTGPYTVATPALANAHKTGEQVFLSRELTRQMVNEWARQVPNGVAACIDFEQVAQLKGQWSVPDMRLFGTDGLHPLRSLYQRMGEITAASIPR